MLSVVFVDFTRLTRKLFHKSYKIEDLLKIFEALPPTQRRTKRKKNSCKLQSVFLELNLLLRHVEAWLGSLIS